LGCEDGGQRAMISQPGGAVNDEVSSDEEGAMTGAGSGSKDDVLLLSSPLDMSRSSAPLLSAALQRKFFGAFRHIDCRLIRGNDDEQFHDGMCGKCASITKEPDFRNRALRSSKLSSSVSAHHTNFSRFGVPQLLERCRVLRAERRAALYQVYFLSRRLAALQGRTLRLIDRAEEAAGRGDVRKIVDELVRASSTLTEHSVLRNFLLDLCKNLNAKSAKGRRWHESTKHLYEVCYILYLNVMMALT
jgi:hypothetical protein